MRALFTRSLIPLALVLLLAPPVFGVGPNRIHDVRLSLQSGNAVVEIAGERAPNFTSFKQDNPRRIIVDVAESDLGNVPDLIRGDGKLVNEISTRRYGRPPHSVSRVVIALNHEAEYRVTSRGGSLFVHVMPGAGGLLVSAGVPLSPEFPPPPPVDEAPPSAPAAPPVRPEPSAARPAGAAGPAVAPSAVTRAAAAPVPAPIPPRTSSPAPEPVLLAKADAPAAAPPAPPAPAPEPVRTSVVATAPPRTAVPAGVGSNGPAPRPEPIRLAQADDSSEPPPEVEEVSEEPPPPPP
ncbi:MAG: AMIN domain-containing protein, partial [Myxococcales bacterium]|nr:AMIN domain-containing protein [Myxococcales bacterium]